jgi:hypothetical protein
MQQILHIFKKDVRRHWPEILISVALLGLYAKVMTHQADYYGTMAPNHIPWAEISASTLAPLMLIFWIFLTIRVVQGERLVGDKQWWITKPYEWWKLLAAKEVFLLAFIGAPLFLVQLYLLHDAGFAIHSHFFGIVRMQFALALILFLPAVALASLTKNLGQALIVLLIAFIVFFTITSQLSRVPNSSMSSAVQGLEEIESVLLLGSITGAAGWQYARRKTWASRGLFVAGAAVVILISALTPYAMFVNRKYPMLESKDAPAQISAAVVPKSTKTPPEWFDGVREIPLIIPVNDSGALAGALVVVDGIKLTMETISGTKWEPGWTSQGMLLWPQGGQKQISYQIDRKMFEQTKAQTGTLHIEFALTEYQAEDARDLVLHSGEFADPTLGLCAFSTRNPSLIMCRRPFHIPGLIATFDPSQASCPAPSDDNAIPEDKISHAWYPPSYEGSAEPGLNPVEAYPVSFGTGEVVFTSDKRQKQVTVYLCSGAKVTLAKPHAARHARITVDLNNITLQDLVNFGDGRQVASQIGLMN